MFCNRLDKMHHRCLTSTNLLPTNERVHQCIHAITFKFVNNNCPFHLNEIFEFPQHCRIDTKNRHKKLHKQSARTY